jgi:hypothetical protein
VKWSSPVRQPKITRQGGSCEHAADNGDRVGRQWPDDWVATCARNASCSTNSQVLLPETPVDRVRVDAPRTAATKPSVRGTAMPADCCNRSPYRDGSGLTPTVDAADVLERPAGSKSCGEPLSPVRNATHLLPTDTAGVGQRRRGNGERFHCGVCVSAGASNSASPADEHHTGLTVKPIACSTGVVKKPARRTRKALCR